MQFVKRIHFVERSCPGGKREERRTAEDPGDEPGNPRLEDQAERLRGQQGQGDQEARGLIDGLAQVKQEGPRDVGSRESRHLRG